MTTAGDRVVRSEARTNLRTSVGAERVGTSPPDVQRGCGWRPAAVPVRLNAATWGMLGVLMADRVLLETDDATRRRMSRQPSRDTSPERALRSRLHRMGLRFRIHRRPVVGVRREADLVFPGARVAVFVDGCFWHRCPHHGTSPKNNGAWWAAKLATNVARDADTDRRLAEAGWQVVRIWEHEETEVAAVRVAGVVYERLREFRPPS
jgi:DNA mismatch endonuclease (patch repair protein)